MQKINPILFEKMRGVVNRHVSHYVADFGIDVELLMCTNHADSAWLWVVRDHGTHLTRYKDTAEALLSFYGADTSCFFYLLSPISPVLHDITEIVRAGGAQELINILDVYKEGEDL